MKRLPVSTRLHPLAREVFEVMDARGAVWAHVAQKAGVDRMTISHWAQGRVTPSLPNIVAVANALGFDLVLIPSPSAPSPGGATAPGREPMSSDRATFSGVA